MARTITIHQSLHRHNQILGAERELVLFSALIALIVAIGGLTLVAFAASALFWCFSIFALRQMTKVDPMMSKIWLKHTSRQTVYMARASRWRYLEGFKC